MCEKMYRLIKEGETEVFIPLDNDPDIPSASASVFYNPAMEMNRDINVAVTSVYAKKLIKRKGFSLSQITYADAFSASGIRGLRIAKEIGLSVVLNDWKKEAVSLIQKNIDHNQLNPIENNNFEINNFDNDIESNNFDNDIEINNFDSDIEINNFDNDIIKNNISKNAATATCMSANKLLFGQKFAIVDIDPFGTPAPFLDSAVSSASFFLGVTATDTAPLCGAHLKSGMRKYGAVPLNNEFHSEMGLRILIGSIARAASKFDKGVRPLFSHSTRHYVRVYAEVLNGAGNADKTLKEIGFIAWCPVCRNLETKNGLAVFMNEECPFCQNKRKMAGPLWLGSFKDVDFCNEVIEELQVLPFHKKNEAIKLLTLCREEADIPFFYDQHILCEKLKISAPPIEPFLNDLRENGFIATRTHFSGTSFKTDAPMDVILKILSAQ